MRNRTGFGLPAPSADRLHVFATWWLGTLEAEAQDGDRSANTVDNARWAVEKWIVPPWGNKRPRELQHEDVESSMLAAIAAEGRAKSWLVRVRSILGQILDTAERRGKVARNVARNSKMRAIKRATVTRRSLTPEQAEALLQAIKGDRLEASTLPA